MPSDRTKRRLVLMPTRILPHTQRIAARRSLLAQLELGRVRRAGIAVIAHPKSGNTWLRSMLGRACQLHYGLLDLMQVLFIESNPIPLKSALFMMGKIPNATLKTITVTP